MAVRLDDTHGGVELPVKVVPGASRTRIMGEWNGRLRVAVAAPADKGRANAALESFLARTLGLRRQAVTIVRGQSSPLKTVRLEAVEMAKVAAKLGL